MFAVPQGTAEPRLGITGPELTSAGKDAGDYLPGKLTVRAHRHLFAFFKATAILDQVTVCLSVCHGLLL